MSNTGRLDSKKIGELLENLLGRCVAVRNGKAPGLGKDFCGVGNYRLDEGELVAVAACDVHFAASAGACLSMIPADAAAEMAAAEDLSDALQENVGEIFNILAVGIARSEGPPLRLAECEFGAGAPDGAPALVESAAKRIELVVEIEGYGEGALAIYATD